jgi:mannosyltransferase
MIRPMTEELAAAPGRLDAGREPWGAAAVGDRAFRAWIGVSALASTVLGTVTLSREPLWNDEIGTIALVERPFGEFLHELPHRQNGMLFDIVLWPLVQLAGPSSAVARLPALGAVVLAVVLCGLVGSRLAGRRAGLLAAGLFALHPAAVYYAQEARPYGFVLLFALLSVWTLLRALDEPTLWRWLAYVLSLGALAYSHDFALLAVLAHPSLVFAHQNRVARRRFLLALGIPVLLAIPLLVLIPADWGKNALYWVPDPSPDQVRATFGLLAGRQAYLIPIALVLGWALLSPTARGRARQIVASLAGTYSFLALWLLAPVTVLYLVSQFQPVLVPRYTLVSLPAVCLSLALAVSLLRPRPALVAAGLLAAMLLVRAVDDDLERTKSDWPGAASYLSEAAAPDEPIAVVGDALWHADALFYYAPGFGVDRDRLLWGDDAEERLPARFVLVGGGGSGMPLLTLPGRGSSVWVVLSNFVSPRVQASLDRLNAACDGADTRSFTDIDVVHLTGCAPAR